MKSVLGKPIIYQTYQRLIGANWKNRWLAKHFYKIRDGHKIVDIGCGPGVLLKHVVQKVQYIGIDTNEQYINHARETYKDRGSFLLGSIYDLPEPDRCSDADVVVCKGVVHHLPDQEAEDVFAFAYKMLKPGGRIVTLDPCYVQGQSKISKWLMDRDRGEYIRDQRGYEKIVSKTFNQYTVDIRTDLLRIPYVDIIIHATKQPEPRPTKLSTDTLHPSF